MRKISFWTLLLAFTVSVARGQDAATQEQLNKLTGQIQDLVDAQAAQDKRFNALERQIGDLRDKLNQPAPNDNASADDLRKLATQVQEIDKKRQADNEQVMKAIEKIGKASTSSAHKPPTPANDTPTATLPAGTKQKGYDYAIHAGDTLSAIAKAYREQGVKVTTDQILSANPGLNPSAMYVGKKIFIPDPNAK
jgi:septal ring factor EnvC (AmiA/AmiB activator)